MRLAPLLCAAALLLLAHGGNSSVAEAGGAARSMVEREFQFTPGAFRLVPRGGQTLVEVRGGVPEDRPGYPDLPSVTERVDLPAGQRVADLEVVSLETALLADAVRLPAAFDLRPGRPTPERTAPDPGAFTRRGFQPAIPARLGVQGTQRERNLAAIQVWPVRWDAASGRLERVVRLRLRIWLEPGGPVPLRRERIVPEWEATPAGRRSPAMETSGARLVERRAEPFRPTQLPSVLGSPVAYVIVTGDSLAAAFQPLADWKTQSGQPAVVRTMSFVRQQYPFGADDADRVRRLIRDAYLRWGTQFVLLGGDTDVIPARFASTIFYGGESIPSDLYYSCLDGNWNADADSLYGEGYDSSASPGDAADLLPEVWVGRAPVKNATQAQLFVNKTLQYIKQPVGDYMNRFLFFAEVMFPQDWTPGQPISLDGAELIENDVLPLLDAYGPDIKYARLYENYTDASWRPGAIQETHQTVKDSLNRGFNISVHAGHGYRTVMSCGDGNLTSNDAFALANGNRLTNLYAIDCTSNAIDFPTIGESFLLDPNGGAVTNIGSSRFDFPTTGRAYQQEFFRLLFQDSITAIGEAQGKQKLPFLAQAGYDGEDRWTQMTLLLLGDPSLEIYTDTPRTLAVTAPSSMPVSSQQLSVHVETGGVPLMNARVTAYCPGHDYASLFTDGAGNVAIPFHPDSTGSLTLTVTDFNCRPWQGTLPIVASAGAALGDLAPAIDDDNLGGTRGNGNGRWEAGEKVDLRVPVRNNGGAMATAVSGTLTTTDPLVILLAPAVSYGDIAPGTTSNPAVGFRDSLPYTCPDQREIPFTLTLGYGSGQSATKTFRVVVGAPELVQSGHTVSDAGGNGDGHPDPGETVSCTFSLKNLGTGVAQGLYGRLRSSGGLASISDSTVSWPDLQPGQEAAGDPVVYVPSSANARLELHVWDAYGERLVQPIDLSYPPTPVGLEAFGGATSVKLTWAHLTTPDLRGYRLYRATAPAGPYSPANSNPTDRIGYYLDTGLAKLTRYYYEVAAVDSSGNESARSPAVLVSTNPPAHAVFPIPTGGTTPSPVTVEHLYPGYPQEILAGSEVLYLWHADGNAPVDADGAGSTSGDFTTQGKYYPGGASVADLDGDGVKEIVAATWTSQQLLVFDLQGGLKPGFPVALGDPIWSSVAIGDLDHNGHQELVFGSQGTRLYAFRDNGTEWMNGDSDPTTNGVFKVMGSNYNSGTPALADLDGDGFLDIIYGSFDGNLYAWHANGTSLPGFPVNYGAGISASVAVGYLDGPGDTQLDIVVAPNNNLLSVVRANGTTRPGFPVFLLTGGNSRTPSPALADMNGDGYLDIVCAGTNGGIYVIDRNGLFVPPWNNIRYSTMLSGASESSPVVADIDGDGKPDVIMGDETGRLAALAGGTGAMMAGFPIQLDGEAKGTPAVCDCDGDGKTEIVEAGWDKNVYMWDYDYTFSPGGAPPWPQFHHDSQRTGSAGTPILLGVEDRPGTPPGALELARPAPNPARAASRLTYGVPADRAGQAFELAVFDLSGRRLRTLARGVARAGRFSAAWDLSDEHGAPVADGVYFLRLSLGGRALSRKLAVLR